MTGVYIHDDGTACGHGVDPATLDAAVDAALDDAIQGREPEILSPSRAPVRCRDGQRLTGYRLDPDQPAP